MFSRAGHWQGIASGRSGILLLLSEVPAGREYGLTAKAVLASAGDVELLQEFLFDSSTTKWQRFGFSSACGSFDPMPLHTAKWHYVTLIFPYWALMLLLAPLPLQALYAALVRRRRRVSGQCAHCGFDLRASSGRCPECGTPIVSTNSQPLTGRSRVRFDGVVISIVSLAAGVTWLAWSAHQRRQPADSINAALAEAAGLNRNVQNISAVDMPLATVLRQLEVQTGTRIILSSTIAGRSVPTFNGLVHGGLEWKSPVNAQLHDVPLGAALKAVLPQGQFVLPLHAVPTDNGSIFVGSTDELPPLFRIFDERQCFRVLAAGAPSVQRNILYTRTYGMDGDSGDTWIYHLLALVETADMELSADNLSAVPCSVNGWVGVVEDREHQQQVEAMFGSIMSVPQPWPSGVKPRVRDTSDFYPVTENRP